MTARPSSSADLRARVLGAAHREPAFPRPRESLRRALWLALGFACAAAVALLRAAFERARAASDLAAHVQPLWRVVSAQGEAAAHRPLGYVLTLEVAWALVVLAATWAGILRGRSMLGRSASTLLVVATLTPALLAISWLGVAHAQLPMLDDAPAGRVHLDCALMSIAYSLGPLVAFFAVRRSTAPFNPRRSGAAIGAVAGAWGALLYVASCECSSPVHMALSHLLPVALLAMSGALVGPRVLGLRA